MKMIGFVAAKTAARLAALAAVAALGLASPQSSRALAPDDLIGTWEFQVTKAVEPKLIRPIPFVLDVWKDEKGNLDGYFAGLGMIRPVADFKIDGDKFACKVLHANTKPGTLGGPVKDGVATLTLDESHSGAAPDTREYRRLPESKAASPVNESYEGNFSSEMVEGLPGAVKFKTSISFVTPKKGDDVGASVTIDGAKHAVSLIRFSRGRVYLEWPDKANTDGEKGRFLGVIKDGKLSGQLDTGGGKGYLTLDKAEDEPLPGKP